MARKTFKERILKMEEAAWVVKNETGELKQLYSELEEEVVNLTEQLRVSRLEAARYKQQLNRQALSLS